MLGCCFPFKQPKYLRLLPIMGDIGGLQMTDPSDNPATGFEYGAEKAAELRVA
jgi:hypothetical protein